MYGEAEVVRTVRKTEIIGTLMMMTAILMIMLLVILMMTSMEGAGKSSESTQMQGVATNYGWLPSLLRRLHDDGYSEQRQTMASSPRFLRLLFPICYRRRWSLPRRTGSCAASVYSIGKTLKKFFSPFAWSVFRQIVPFCVPQPAWSDRVTKACAVTIFPCYRVTLSLFSSFWAPCLFLETCSKELFPTP